MDVGAVSFLALNKAEFFPHIVVDGFQGCALFTIFDFVREPSIGSKSKVFQILMGVAEKADGLPTLIPDFHCSVSSSQSSNDKISPESLRWKYLHKYRGHGGLANNKFE